MKHYRYTWLSLILYFCYFVPVVAFAQLDEDGLGQTIQIYTNLHSFFGRPSWTLIVRDVDTGTVYPYLFDIERGTNYWTVLTFSRHYLITVSRMQFSTFKYRCNMFKKYIINDFCQLESRGRIIRGESMSVTIMGDLSPFTDTFSCHVSRYLDGNFAISASGST